jgi:hypothetical protein
MTLDRLKTEINDIMSGCPGKITLSKKIGKRNEYLFSIGKTEFLPSEVIWENGEYTLFAEGIAEEKKKEILKTLEVSHVS